MRDRPFSHPNFGTQARIEQDGLEVRLIFVAGSQEQANSLADSILEQLKAGSLNLTLMGKPTRVTEES